MYKGKFNKTVYTEIKIDNNKINCPIESYDELVKLGEVININNVKINKAKLCRDLKTSYNTLNKRIKNIPLKETRCKPSMIDKYKSEIVKLLEDKNKSFKSIRILTEIVNK